MLLSYNYNHNKSPPYLEDSPDSGKFYAGLIFTFFLFIAYSMSCAILLGEEPQGAQPGVWKPPGGGHAGIGGNAGAGAKNRQLSITGGAANKNWRSPSAASQHV